MNKYLAFYNGREIEIEAETSYQAQLKAIEILKLSKSNARWLMVVLVEKDGVEITHRTSEI